MEFLISTDKSKLDIPLIWDYLCNKSYWARGCSSKTVIKSIQNSLCFGIYTNTGDQVAFARVVTDYATFGWIMDVFVLTEYQGMGLGKKLVESIMEYPEFASLRRMGLNTKDAHGLYERFGFRNLADPQIAMEKLRKPS